MSGMVSKGEFYYTYSFGSGIHRSHVAKLQLLDGRLKLWILTVSKPQTCS